MRLNTYKHITEHSFKRTNYDRLYNSYKQLLENKFNSKESFMSNL